MLVKFEIIKKILDKLLRDSYVNKSDFIDGVSKSDYGSISKKYTRAFSTIGKMYDEITIASILKVETITYNKGSGKNSASLEISSIYRYFLTQNKNMKDRDFVLRYRYLAEKDPFIKKTLLQMIESNLEDEFITLKQYENVKNNKYLKLIEEAILKNHKITITSHKDKTTEVEPVKIYFDNGYWYFAGLLHEKYDYIIRLDNVKNLIILDDNCTSELEKYRAYTYDAWGNEKSAKKYKITLQVKDEGIYSYFKYKKFNATQKAFIKGKKYFVEFKFRNYYEMVPIILSWIDYIVIDEIVCIEDENKNDCYQELLCRLNNSLGNFISSHQLDDMC